MRKQKDINIQKAKQIKQIEGFLKRYTTYKAGLNSLKKQLNYIMPNMTASYEVQEGSTGTFNIKSDTEKFAIDRIESRKALNIHEDIEKYSLIIESIDQAMNELDDIEHKFVKLRYFNRKTIQRTSDELGYSEKHIFNLRTQIMDKLLILLKGLLHL